MSDITDPSPRQLWKVSYPLMISFLSTFLMLFVDRLFLAHYSKEALNAAAVSGTFAWSLIVTWLTLAALCEVFVAQYNGAKRYSELGRPVWQMIWLALFSTIFFAIAGTWISSLIYGGSTKVYQREYFQWLMLCGPFAVMNAGISAFFIGRGKAQIVKWLSILSNLINVIFDPILIFGIPGFIPSMGIKGAAIATALGYIVQAIVILAIFLNKKHRTEFNTFDCWFRWDLFKRCMKVATPPAIFAGLEIGAWALFYVMMEGISPEHIFICSVCQSIEILFLFYCFGLEKGIAAIAGNMIGAGLHDQLKKLAVSGFKIIGFFSIGIILITMVYPEPLINLFFKNPSSIESPSIIASLTGINMMEYKALIKKSLVFVGLYLIVENVRWLYSGLLTAAGDTLFLMITGTLCVWLFLLVPCYFLVVWGKQSVMLAFVVWVVYSIIASLANYLRFRSGAWKSKTVIDAPKVSNEAEIE